MYNNIFYDKCADTQQQQRHANKFHHNHTAMSLSRGFSTGKSGKIIKATCRNLLGFATGTGQIAARSLNYYSTLQYSQKDAMQ